MGFYHPAQLLQDASRHGVEIRGVDINHSHWDCTLEGRAVRVGMRLVRGLEKSEAMEIVRLVRQHGPFKSISSLWRVGKIKKSALAALAKADAFSSMGLSRQQALWELKRFRDHALPLLEAIEAVREPKPALPEISAEEEVARDYHHLSYSLKAHPLSFYRENLQGVLTTKELNTTARHNQQISVAGIILIRQRPPTASGFVFLTIEDEHGTANLIVKPDIYKRFRQTINDSVYLLTKGRVQRSDGVVHLIVEEIRKFPVGNFRKVSGGIRDYR
jgi:error-prone DNA polymerase